MCTLSQGDLEASSNTCVQCASHPRVEAVGGEGGIRGLQGKEGPSAELVPVPTLPDAHCQGLPAPARTSQAPEARYLHGPLAYFGLNFPSAAPRASDGRLEAMNTASHQGLARVEPAGLRGDLVLDGSSATCERAVCPSVSYLTSGILNFSTC